MSANFVLFILIGIYGLIQGTYSLLVGLGVIVKPDLKENNRATVVAIGVVVLALAVGAFVMAFFWLKP